MSRDNGISSANVLRREVFKSNNDKSISVLIEAGHTGWNVMFSNNRFGFQLVDDSCYNNFETAYSFAVETIGPITIDNDAKKTGMLS